MLAIGNNQQGYSLLDVLCAIAIIGMLGLVVWQSLSVGYATIENARQHTLAVIVASSKLTEIELGLEKLTSGLVYLPPPAKEIEWHRTSTQGQGVEVSWTSGQKKSVYQLWHKLSQ